VTLLRSVPAGNRLIWDGWPSMTQDLPRKANWILTASGFETAQARVRCGTGACEVSKWCQYASSSLRITRWCGEGSVRFSHRGPYWRPAVRPPMASKRSAWRRSCRRTSFASTSPCRGSTGSRPLASSDGKRALILGQHDAREMLESAMSAGARDFVGPHAGRGVWVGRSRKREAGAPGGERRAAGSRSNRLCAEAPNSQSERIDVQVSNGVATLTGDVSAPSLRARAEEIANGVPGIVCVDDRLQVVERDWCQQVNCRSVTERRRNHAWMGLDVSGGGVDRGTPGLRWYRGSVGGDREDPALHLHRRLPREPRDESRALTGVAETGPAERDGGAAPRGR
jgi:BON domain